jgi:abelson tyrosine-protein kinase 1
MIHQGNRPFLKRYLKRDEIMREIAGCDTALGDAFALFNVRRVPILLLLASLNSSYLLSFQTSIQIRVLKLVQANEAQRRADEARRAAQANAFAGAFLGQGSTGPPPLPPLGLFPGEASTSTDTLTPITFPEPSGPFALPSVAPPPAAVVVEEPIPEKPEEVRARLAELSMHQNARDRDQDIKDLRQLVRNAMLAHSDAELLESLEIQRTDIPEAMKTLQRALEAEVERERAEDLTASTSLISRRASLASRHTNRSVRTAQSIESLVSVSTAASEVPSLTHSGGTSSGESSIVRASGDTLDREFMECGIDALRRLSKGAMPMLPSWTITKYVTYSDTWVTLLAPSCYGLTSIPRALSSVTLLATASNHLNDLQIRSYSRYKDWDWFLL